MPLIEVTHDRSLTDTDLRNLVDHLPDLVAEAVDCPDEQWNGATGPGDIEIRLRAKSDHDVGQLRVVVEVHTKLFASRLVDKQQRADLSESASPTLD